MPRIAIIVTALLLLLVACSTTEPSDPEDSQKSEVQAPQTPESSAPSNDDVSDPTQRARRVIADQFADRYARRIEVAHIEGWTFFHLFDMEKSHPPPRCEVVRADGTLVTDDETAELLEILDAMGAFEDPSAPADDMAAAANALVGECLHIPDAEHTAQLATRVPDRDITPPTATRDGDAITISYYSPAPTSYDTHIYHQQIVATPDDIVDVHVEPIEME